MRGHEAPTAPGQPSAPPQPVPDLYNARPDTTRNPTVGDKHRVIKCGEQKAPTGAGRPDLRVMVLGGVATPLPARENIPHLTLKTREEGGRGN